MKKKTLTTIMAQATRLASFGPVFIVAAFPNLPHRAHTVKTLIVLKYNS